MSKTSHVVIDVHENATIRVYKSAYQIVTKRDCVVMMTSDVVSRIKLAQEFLNYTE